MYCATPSQSHTDETALVAPALMGGHRSGFGHLFGLVDIPVGISPCYCTFNNSGYYILDVALS